MAEVRSDKIKTEVIAGVIGWRNTRIAAAS